MDDTQLLSRLEQDFAGCTLDRPAGEVVMRGRRLRRRRQRLPLLGAITLTLVATQVVAQSRSPQSAAFAGWTSRAQATDPVTAAAIDRACRRREIPATLPLRVLDRRGDFALSVYTDGRSLAVCERFRGTSPGQRFTQGGSSGPSPVTHAADVSGSKPVVLEGAASIFLRHEGSAVSAYGWVGPKVAKVVLISGGYRTQATLTGALFSGWWPEDAAGSLGVISCLAYDAAGALIGQDTLAAR